MRISKQIRSVAAKFPAQRNRELLLLEQGILNNGTGNVFAQSMCRSTPIALASCRKISLQADAGGPIAIPEQMATTRLAGLSPEIGFFAFLARSLAFAIFGDSRFLSSGADSTITPIFAGGEFAIREQTGIGRDDGSTKLKHRSAVEIESENLAVRFTPFWPKLRLPMLIGKTSKHSGNRRPADVSDGAHRAGAVPGRPLA